MGPTLAGFLIFVRNVMGITSVYLPDDSPALNYAFQMAIMTVNPQLGLECPPMPAAVGGGVWTIYAVAVYNLGGSLLINYAPDQAGQTYFKTLRGPIADGGFGVTNFVAGVVQSAADETTSDSLLVPDALKGLTLGDLQRLKDPYGRQYLALAQDFGTLWGSS